LIETIAPANSNTIPASLCRNIGWISAAAPPNIDIDA
jgi:hypothetical protein